MLVNPVRQAHTIKDKGQQTALTRRLPTPDAMEASVMLPARQNTKPLSKPAFGAPCNGCGLCCRLELCGLALEVLGADAPAAPCPFIVEREGVTRCGVIEAADKKDIAFGGYMKWRLGIGAGCQVED